MEKVFLSALAGPFIDCTDMVGKTPGLVVLAFPAKP
jgi:hypothetical protein